MIKLGPDGDIFIKPTKISYSDLLDSDNFPSQ